MNMHPVIYDPSLAQDHDAIERLRAQSGVRVCDTLNEQLADLAQTRSPARTLLAADLADAVKALLGSQALELYGRWVWFPWNLTLVHILPPAEFRELRTDRNRNKITTNEQARLGKKVVAVAGLSVGLAMATTLALEGIGGKVHLADFDTLSVSNMNRLLASVSELGVPKVEIAARRLYELDPYLDIVPFPEGVRDDNMERFLAGVDLLCEECDDLYAKVRLRELARERGVPVIMETSDRGMLDVERFDQEPSRPLLHGAMEVGAAAVRNFDPPARTAFVRNVLGEHMSPAMVDALEQIGKTQRTWPQLGSGVTLGGATGAHAARRVLLGQAMPSGRYFVDLDQLLVRRHRESE